MKIAVTSQGNTLDSNLDPRFGRADYILVVDTETLEFEVLDNTRNKNTFKGAGIQASVMISDAGAQVLMTGYCGPNAFATLEKAGIKVVNDQTGRVIDAVLKYKDGNLVHAASANKDGHW